MLCDKNISVFLKKGENVIFFNKDFIYENKKNSHSDSEEEKNFLYEVIALFCKAKIIIYENEKIEENKKGNFFNNFFVIFIQFFFFLLKIL